MRHNVSDADLIALLRDAQDGDSTALHRLLAEMYPAVLLYAQRRVKGTRDAPDRAEDIAQEVLLRVIDRLHTCAADRPASLFAWVLAITRNAAIDTLRQLHSQAEWVRSMPELDLVQEDFCPATWSSSSERVESHTSRLLADLLDRILCTLTPGTQRVLHLRAQHKLTWPEIAASIQTTAAGAKRRFQRAQVDLRATLAEHVRKLPQPDRGDVVKRLRWMGISLPVDVGAGD
jgi:RNA polymerase sigma factor (sigma-70 family)